MRPSLPPGLFGLCFSQLRRPPASVASPLTHATPSSPSPVPLFNACRSSAKTVSLAFVALRSGAAVWSPPASPTAPLSTSPSSKSQCARHTKRLADGPRACLLTTFHRLDTMPTSLSLTLSDLEFMFLARLRQGLPAGPTSAPIIRHTCCSIAVPIGLDHSVLCTWIAQPRVLRYEMLCNA
jgi:hypothetical protein